MDSTTCDVQHHGQMLDVLDGLPPSPASIKDQMPVLAQCLQELAAGLGRNAVQEMVKASVDLRRAWDADDVAAVNEVYRRRVGWIAAVEGGCCLGVPAEQMRTFAQRHRERRASR